MYMYLLLRFMLLRFIELSKNMSSAKIAEVSKKFSLIVSLKCISGSSNINKNQIFGSAIRYNLCYILYTGV